MSTTTSAILQSGALGLLFICGVFAIRYLAQELKATRKQLQDLENQLLKNAGLPTVPMKEEEK